MIFESMYDEDPYYMDFKFTPEQFHRYFVLNTTRESDLTEEEKKELRELYEYGNTPPDNLNNQQK